MARSPDKRYSEAYKLFKNGKKLIEIANQLSLPEGTVRRWKSTHKWDNERSDNKSERSIKKKKVKNKPITNEVKQVMENPELTDKQRLFCLNYIKCFNATKAYQKAYECSYETAMTEGCKALRNPKIAEQINELKQAKLNQSFLKPEDIFQKYMDIAFADIVDYVTFGTKEVTLSNDEGMTATTEMSYVDVNPSWMVDGTLITEISKGKDGIKLKLADRMKALDWLAEHMDMATTEQRARIEHMRSKDILDRERFEHDKSIDSKKYW
jgi:phage terminase small subunit